MFTAIFLILKQVFVEDLFVGMSDELLLSFRRAFAEFFVETLIETSNDFMTLR